jgi:class 3 adenylate cyclase
MYTLVSDGTGALTLAQRYTVGGMCHKAGAPFSLTEPSPERQGLESWYRERFHHPLDLSFKLPPDSQLFLHPDPLVAGCKEEGCMLDCVPNVGFSSPQQLGPQESQPVQLCATWAYGRPEREQTRDRTAPHPIGWWVPQVVLRELNEALPEETSPVRRISSWPIGRTFVYLDVSDFSRFSPKEESLVINSLVRIVNHPKLWQGQADDLPSRIEARMCIGDGYIFVFREPMEGVYFAAYLAHLIEVLVANRLLPVSFHFRMGAHLGEVYTFWDPGRNDWNYIGDGINGGNRVLSAIDKGYDDMLYISGEVRQELMATAERFPGKREILDHLHNRGRRPDKHGRPWRVYEVGHAALCQRELNPRLWS